MDYETVGAGSAPQEPSNGDENLDIESPDEEIEYVLDDKPQRVRCPRTPRAIIPAHNQLGCFLLPSHETSPIQRFEAFFIHHNPSDTLHTSHIPICAACLVCCSQVVQGLWIGSLWAEMNESALNQAGITDILQVRLLLRRIACTSVLQRCSELVAVLVSGAKRDCHCGASHA